MSLLAVQRNKVMDDYDLRPEWQSKMHDEIEILLEQFNGRIGCFRRLTVLFDKLIELGEVGFN